MARLMVLYAFVLLLMGQSATAHADLYYRTVMADNPVAYWRLNETGGTAFFDSAGSHHGTLSGAMTLNQPGAVIGREPDAAIIFEGGYGYAPYAAELANPIFSIECWARVDGGAGTWRAPMMYRWVEPDTGPSWKCYGYNLYVNNNDDHWEFWIGRGPTSSGFAAAKGPKAVYGKWTHLVGTYDGSMMRFYVDGELAASRTETYGVLPPGTSPFHIAGGPRFLGGVDEMAVYDYVLSPDQVLAHFLAVPEPSAVALCFFGFASLAMVGRRRRFH